jgi:RAD3-like DEAD/DEAH box helicase
MSPGFGAGLVIPDLWQQEAVRALQQGKDVVVQAPTGSGKTYIFELLYPNLKTQAVFTVPTRAVTTGSGFEPRLRAFTHCIQDYSARQPCIISGL